MASPPSEYAAPAIGASALRGDAARNLVAIALCLALPALALARAARLGPAFLPCAALLFAAIALAVLGRLPGHHPFPRFGAPNRVTSVRAALTALCGGLAAVAPALDAQDRWLWAFVAMATTALLLDGVDGWLSRRLRLSSAFGARYDMEIDALLILLLALAAWRLDKAGAWILAIGAMRYGFVAAGHAWPWLAAKLPPSRRRQAICVVQGIALCVALAPAVPHPYSALPAALALALLVASFALDVRWLWRGRIAAMRATGR